MYNIYLISAESNGEILYKIGYTKREVSKRIKEFRTGNSAIFEIVDVFSSRWGTKIESSLHSHFNKFRVGGEWFSLDVYQLKEFRRICEISHNNFELLEKYNTYVMEKGWPS